MSNRSGYSLARILTLGLVFHLVYIGTVFDCYFTSPVVHGMRPHRLPQAEAKRLVLIVGTETLFDISLSCMLVSHASESQVTGCARTSCSARMPARSYRTHRSESPLT